jgi:hypothetical protein
MTQVNSQFVPVAMDMISPRFGPDAISLQHTQTPGPQEMLKAKRNKKTMATMPAETLAVFSEIVPNPPMIMRRRASSSAP